MTIKPIPEIKLVDPSTAQRARYSNVVSFLFYLTIWLSVTMLIISLSAGIALRIFAWITGVHLIQ